ncbi:hypothetical protein [Asanoa hainanensis]|uniref:hypothetical protein n=1 Tax=Asanoa hainanensis TaxID=560556 RepID=UPI00117EE4BE|nr:hypothetical protein [Asanoa hainanensis]
MTNRAPVRRAFAGGAGKAVRTWPASTVLVPRVRFCMAAWLSGSRPGTLEVAQWVPEVRWTLMPRSRSLFIIKFHLWAHIAEPYA